MNKQFKSRVSSALALASCALALATLNSVQASTIHNIRVLNTTCRTYVVTYLVNNEGFSHSVKPLESESLKGPFTEDNWFMLLKPAKSEATSLYDDFDDSLLSCEGRSEGTPECDRGHDGSATRSLDSSSLLGSGEGFFDDMSESDHVKFDFFKIESNPGVLLVYRSHDGVTWEDEDRDTVSLKDLPKCSDGELELQINDECVGVQFDDESVSAHDIMIECKE